MTVRFYFIFYIIFISGSKRFMTRFGILAWILVVVGRVFTIFLFVVQLLYFIFPYFPVSTVGYCNWSKGSYAFWFLEWIYISRSAKRPTSPNYIKPNNSNNTPLLWTIQMARFILILFCVLNVNMHTAQCASTNSVCFFEGVLGHCDHTAKWIPLHPSLSSVNILHRTYGWIILVSVFTLSSQWSLTDRAV